MKIIGILAVLVVASLSGFFFCVSGLRFIWPIRQPKLMVKHPSLRSKIIDLIGSDAFTAKGHLNQLIASMAFQDKSILEKLNGIVHPAVREDFERFIKTSMRPCCLRRLRF